MQNEIIKKCQIPATDGTIKNPGWSRKELMEYVRSNVRAPWYRKKEWDYYLFTNEDFGVAFTISDLGYVGLLSVSVLDFKNATEHTETELAILPRGQKFSLGTTTADAGAECHTKRLDMRFSNEKGNRHISCNFRNFDGDKNLTAELDVYSTMDEAMYICTPWKEKATAFYYNCKMNCLEAEGKVRVGNEVFTLDRQTSLGVLDWGRGVWTYDNTWYWGTDSGRLNGKPFGFNLGYGFSDRSSASENVLFYKGKIHKLSEVTFNIPKKDGKPQYTAPWKITSEDGRFEADFVPILDRAADLDFGVIVSNQHQVFGRMTGYAITDEGEKVNFETFVCALEEVHNRY